jgi:hypothetical protein
VNIRYLLGAGTGGSDTGSSHSALLCQSGAGFMPADEQLHVQHLQMVLKILGRTARHSFATRVEGWELVVGH